MGSAPLLHPQVCTHHGYWPQLLVHHVVPPQPLPAMVLPGTRPPPSSPPETGERRWGTRPFPAAQPAALIPEGSEEVWVPPRLACDIGRAPGLPGALSATPPLPPGSLGGRETPFLSPAPLRLQQLQAQGLTLEVPPPSPPGRDRRSLTRPALPSRPGAGLRAEAPPGHEEFAALVSGR